MVSSIDCSGSCRISLIDSSQRQRCYYAEFIPYIGKGGKMVFKRLKCPVCGQKVSFFWNYFSFPPIAFTCSNCKTKIKWRQIFRLYSLISGIIMFSIFFIIRDYIRSPYIAIIIGFIPAQIFFLIILQKVKIISKGEEKRI